MKRFVLYFVAPILAAFMILGVVLKNSQATKPRIRVTADSSNNCQQAGFVSWEIYNAANGAILKIGQVPIIVPQSSQACHKAVRYQLLFELGTYIGEVNLLEPDGTVPSLFGTYPEPPHIYASASLDFPEIPSGTGCDDLTIAVPGAATGDVASLGIPAGFGSPRSTFIAWVSAADTVKVRHCAHGGTPDPAPGVFKVAVLK